MNKEYSFWKGLSKAIFNILVVAIPLLIEILPAEWANLTLSGALLIFVNYIKVIGSTK